MKIGISVPKLERFEGHDLVDTFEIRKNFEDRQNIIRVVNNIQKKFKGKDLSFHSGLGRIFSCVEWEYPEFMQAEIGILKAEIITASIVGADRIIFHIRNGFYNEEERIHIQELIDFAAEKGIKLLCESNNHSKAEYVLDFLKHFPKINYCFDFGHVNTGIKGGTWGMELNDFIDAVNERTIHVHAHNNHGEHDEHNNLDEGTFPWRDVLKKLTHIERIILENKDFESAKQSLDLIKKFFD